MFKKFLEEKGISQEEFDKMDATETAKLQGEYNDARAKELSDLKAEVKNAATSEEVKTVSDKLDAFLDKSKEVNDETIKGLKDELEKLDGIAKAQGTEMAKLMEKGNHTGAVTFEEAVKNTFTEEKFKELQTWKESKATYRFGMDVTKDTLTTSVTTATPPANAITQDQTTYSEYPRTQIFVEQYLDSGSTDKPTIAYTSELPGTGDAATVAEGSLKPLIDSSTITNYSEAKKVAGRKRISEESLSDYPFMLSLVTNTLKRKHDIARQNQILNGDGLGTNLTGITGLATVFNPALVAAITVPNAQLYDAICAVVVAIQVDSEGMFSPNVAFVNSIDALQMKLTKDADGNYVMPPFKGANDEIIDGVTVVARPSITQGEFVIGDMKNVKLRNYWNYRVEFGRDGNDFSENMVTAIGESRLHLYIDENEKRGIVSGAFADVITAIS